MGRRTLASSSRHQEAIRIILLLRWLHLKPRAVSRRCQIGRRKLLLVLDRRSALVQETVGWWIGRSKGSPCSAQTTSRLQKVKEGVRRAKRGRQRIMRESRWEKERNLWQGRGKGRRLNLPQRKLERRLITWKKVKGR